MGNTVISDKVKDKFKMRKGFAPGKYIFYAREIDTTTVDLATLEEAVEKGFDVVEPVKAPTKTEKK
jgi:hypothetical protein